MIIKSQSEGSALNLGGDATWGKFCKQLPSQTPQKLIIDLENVEFIKPIVIAGLISVAQRTTREGNQVEVRAPEQANARNYLSRMHLPAALDDLNIEHNFRPVNERHLPGNLLELHKFNDEDSGVSLGDIVYEKMAHDSADEEDFAYELRGAIVELASNVAWHAEVDHGYAIAQTYKYGDRKKISFAVADSGIGIKASLEKNPSRQIDSDESAIRIAIEKYVSKLTERGRGAGLTSVVKFAVQAGGTVTLASMGSYLEIKRDPSGNSDTLSRLVIDHPLRKPYHGTIIGVDLPVALN